MSQLSFVAHVHASWVRARALRGTATLGLGVAGLVLFGILAITGVLLALHYVPSSADAYGSVLNLEYAVPFGQTVRALHRWASDALLVVAGLHTLRIIAMAAYVRRALNWLVGLGAGAVLLLSALCGYVLPWDQRAYWAARVVGGLADSVPVAGPWVATMLFGGVEPGPATLGRLYALHATALPALLLGLLVVHLWRVRRDGGLATDANTDVNPRAGTARDELLLVPAHPHLFARELVVALVLLAAMLLVATIFRAPLGPLADITRPANPEKAPWYFLGLQELASRGAVRGALAVAGLLAAGLVVLPWVDKSTADLGRWLPDPRSRRFCATAALATAAAISLAYGLVSGEAPLAFAPLLVTLGMSVVGPVLVWLWLGPTGRRVALQVMLVALITALMVFTVVGMCRGADWIFAWPWQAGGARGL